MSDDGLLLNFAPAPSQQNADKTKRNFKGKWKDRLRAKNIQAHRKTKPKSVPDGVGQGSHKWRNLPASNEDVEYSSQPNTDQTADADGPTDKNKPSRQRTAAVQRPKDSGKQSDSQTPSGANTNANGFVSSLFTYNPDVPLQKEADEADRSTVPSNAPMTKAEGFLSLGIASTLCTVLKEKLKIDRPTGIQHKAIPMLVSTARDMLIQAETGSGKTLAYLLPMITRLLSLPSSKRHREGGLWAIIITPTRELSNQVLSVLTTILNQAEGHWIVPCNVIGGEKKKSEKARIRKGVNILVGTPGRLLDHLENTSSLVVRDVKWCIMDEGDRLMDLGLGETVKKILDFVRSRRRDTELGGRMPTKLVNVMCSATMHEETKDMAGLADSIFVHAEDSSQASSVPAQLDQKVLFVPAKLRLVTLAAVLKEFARQSKKIIVFLSCAASVDFHLQALSVSEHSKTVSDGDTVRPAFAVDSSLSAFRLHGSIQQHQRTSTLTEFAKASSNPKQAAVLLCTDVAARGIDLPTVDLVLQLDAPFSIDDYLHRIGRTARAGQPGTAYLFLLPNEAPYKDYLTEQHQIRLSEMQGGYDQCLRLGFGGFKRREYEDRATEWQLSRETWILSSPTAQALAKNAFQSHIRAYATHISSEKKMFSLKALHLGHIAKSFGLRHAPSQLKSVSQGQAPTKRKRDVADSAQHKHSKRDANDDQAASKMRRKAKEHMSNEFTTSLAGYAI